MNKTKTGHEQGSEAPVFYEDVVSFLEQNAHVVFRFWVYKKLFTPYEIEHKFMDESQFVSTHASFGVIQEALALPDGDVLLGIGILSEHITDLYADYFHREYHKLSEISLEYHPCDQEKFYVELQ